MVTRFYRTLFAKLAYEAKLLLGLVDLGAFRGDSVAINGCDVTDAYLALFLGGDREGFRRLAACAVRDGAVLPNCEPLFKRFVYPLLVGRKGSYATGPLALDANIIEKSAARVADALLGEGHYGTVREWLCDNTSRGLFDLEVLQQGLRAAGWHQESAAKAVCTGITAQEDKKMMAEGRRCEALADFMGLPGLRGLAANPRLFGALGAHTFLAGQYRYGDVCAPREGDVFYDCGTYWGDTAIWALGLIGKSGNVVAFEPIGEQAAIAGENLLRYITRHGGKATVERLGVGDRPGTARFSDANGLSGACQCDDGDNVVGIVRIDDYARGNVLWPDFIKMDIEGGELAALRGAEEAIRERRPRLAICVYHKPTEDLWEIPRFIKGCNPSYRLYLKKSAPCNETVLFAVDGPEAAGTVQAEAAA